MNEHLKFAVAPTMTAPTAAITRVDSKLLTDSSKCEGNINLGVFFVRIPRNLDTQSAANRSRSPAQTGHAFHGKLDTSGVTTRGRG